ncbi:hypothetical protein EMCG_06770 [[Emmonsia] crescens]|uniref:Uncharacterized protein n=1 Tax=[Emmonsia] crescens TaxID=73230 RepID=A0A0G2JBI4_9EURO|nr:hypothetical protein EMCG_06770 [Emmonsia crescens UAMH 3008]
MAISDQMDVLKLSDLPKRTALNQDVDENGHVYLPWNLSVDGDSYLPPPAIVTLTLNEVGRALGMGICTYIPASAPFLPLCIPEVYFTGYHWTEREDYAIPIRVLAYDSPQDFLSFAPEGARLSGAIITYDSRAFVGWYREYASHRNGDRINISINLLEHQAWFDSMRCQDNFVVVRRLLQMWSQPVYYGAQVIGDVLRKIKDLQAREMDSNMLMLGYKGGDDIPEYEIDSLDLRLLASTALKECDAQRPLRVVDSSPPHLE